MISFKERSEKKELLDGSGVPFEDIRQNMHELDIINKKLGGHKITIEGLKKFLPKSSSVSKKIIVVEIGCGGGDNLRAIKSWGEKNNYQLQLKGIDKNPDCIVFAESQATNAGIEFISSDYKKIAFEEKPDIIFSSLFCHHFTNEQLTEVLNWKYLNSKLGFFINDLHRHPIAFFSIKMLTKIFSKSYLVKNDAPVSVQRGFIKKDWENIFSKANIENYQCNWKWAFRWLVTCIK